ncbi:hypothetical protein [Paractinoplanes atraurantiacus]|uniref:Uncharacterized protein n=1 Tax=Paractinoplanes atraurantiacus TaxID=1036182 RepID=A0A285J3R6_9ACTN|nr:hypothetical protein [Actinoplanes atraurantiacus]SNY54914.1 hypothetical protein SAMN05421748_115191 [Actinoplanes atraurantiacus]
MRPAADFLVDPYPGERPGGSWLVDADGMCLPVGPDDAMPSGWSVQGAQCLDAWLVRNDAAPLADRVPLLSYGANACPGKVMLNGTPLPVVNLACEMTDLASVWCAGPTRVGRTPSTLTAMPGHRETAVVTMAVPAQLAVLDAVEGRHAGVYALQTLHTGAVTLENGVRVPRPLAYVGVRPQRFPLLIDGRPLLRVAVDYDTATALRRSAAGEPAPPRPIGVSEQVV